MKSDEREVLQFKKFYAVGLKFNLAMILFTCMYLVKGKCEIMWWEDKTATNLFYNCLLPAFKNRDTFNARVFNFEVKNALENFAFSISLVVFWIDSASGTYLEHFTSVLNGFCDSSTAGESSNGSKSLILMEALPFDFKRTPSIRFEWNSLMKFLAESLKSPEYPQSLCKWSVPTHSLLSFKKKICP